MVFKRIEMNGFKSFADPVAIDFNEGITCIVGPNGSGKSNISDAIRWVLGEQSPKMLRGGKMEEVIFSGTQSRRPKGMAEVTIVLENSQGLLPIGFSEVALTRRVYRSGESEYRINGSPCRLRDIRELLMDTGIGVEGYSIIGQGKISDIVNNKMESRREIFEEAAGIVKYKSRKAEAERKLESADLNLDRVQDIIGEIAGRIDKLAEDSRKAEQFLELSGRHKKTEVNVILRNLRNVSSKGQALAQEAQQLAQRTLEERQRKEALEEENRRSREESQRLEEEEETLRGRLAALGEEVHHLNAQEALDRQRLTALMEEKEGLAAERLLLGERIRKEEAAIKEQEALLAAAGEAGRGGSRRLAQKEEGLKELRERRAGLVSQLQQCRDRMLELAGAGAAAASEVDSLNSFLDSLGKRDEQLAEEEESAQSRKGSQLEEIDRLKASLTSGRQRLTELMEEGRALQAALETQRQEEAALIKARGERRIALEKAATREQLLRELEQSYEGYGLGVKRLLAGNLPGILGVVGDLIRVPPGLELALETALGAGLSNIVCQDDKSAGAGVAFLKAQKAGRLTFLPLTSLSSRAVRIPESMAAAEGYLGLAADRIDCPEEIRPAVTYLLGRVVLCRDLASALALSKVDKNRLRFVTLEGDVIHPAGAITGGSPRRGAGDILSRKPLIQSLAERIQALEGDLQADEDRLKELADRKADLLQRSAEAERLKKELEEEVAESRETLSRLEALLALAGESGDKRRREAEDIRREAAGVEKALADLRQAAAEADRESQALDVQAGELTEALAVLEGDLALEEEGARDLALLVSKEEERLSGIRFLLDRMRAGLGELLAEENQKEARAQAAAGRALELEERLQEPAVTLAQLETERTALSESLAEKNEQRRGLARLVEELEQRRKKLEQALYDTAAKSREVEVQSARISAQEEALKERLWSEFELSLAEAEDMEDAAFVLSRGQKESRDLREQIRLLGDVNPGAIQEYRQVKKRYSFLQEQQADLLQAKGELEHIIGDIEQTIQSRFSQSFDAIREHFEATFVVLFGGGHARLSLSDESRPLESSIEIEAQPPGKKLQNINLLSGGEKAMTAIALMFAVLWTKPTPFCILDEVEAALDDMNIERFAQYLRRFERTQFALITHQKVTMEHADVLYGITMPEYGVSSILSLKLDEVPRE